MSSNKSNVVFRSKEPRSTEEIGRFLINAGEKLVSGGSFTVVQDGREIEVTPTGSTKLDLKYKTKGYKEEFEIEIEWRPTGGGSVDIK